MDEKPSFPLRNLKKHSRFSKAMIHIFHRMIINNGNTVFRKPKWRRKTKSEGGVLFSLSYTMQFSFSPIQWSVFSCGCWPEHHIIGTAFPQGNKRWRRGHFRKPKLVLRKHNKLEKILWDFQSENQNHDQQSPE